MDKRPYTKAIVLEPEPFMQYDSVCAYIDNLAGKLYDTVIAVRNIIPGITYFGKAARQREKNKKNHKYNEKRQAKQSRIKSPSGKSKYAKKGNNHDFWDNNPHNNPELTREIDRQNQRQTTYHGGYSDDPYTPSYIWR